MSEPLEVSSDRVRLTVSPLGAAVRLREAHRELVDLQHGFGRHAHDSISKKWPGIRPPKKVSAGPVSCVSHHHSARETRGRDRAARARVRRKPKI